MLFTKVSKFISREYSVYHMTTEVLSWTWLDHNCATGEVKPHHTRKYSPLHTGYLGNQGKHPASQAGVCVKIAGCGAAGSHFRAIFAHRHGARLPMDLLMGPGRSTEDWSSCYKLSASSGDGIVIKSYLWVFGTVLQIRLGGKKRERSILEIIYVKTETKWLLTICYSASHCITEKLPCFILTCLWHCLWSRISYK